MTGRRNGATGALAAREHPQERAVAAVLVISLLAGCSPAVHPAYPHARYPTIEECGVRASQQNQDPTLCEKHVDLGYTVDNAEGNVLAILFIAIIGPLVYIGSGLIYIGSALSRDPAEPSSADARGN